MIKLEISGIGVLDTYPSASVSVKKTNNAFNFGSLKMDRTTELRLPKTDNNRRILGSVGILHHNDQYSVANRRKNAIMTIDGVQLDGNAYVTEVTDTEFGIMFTFGAYRNLQSAYEAGEVRDNVSWKNQLVAYQNPFLKGVSCERTAFMSSVAPATDPYKHLYYDSAFDFKHSAINLISLFSELEQYGVTVNPDGAPILSLINSREVLSDNLYTGFRSSADGIHPIIIDVSGTNLSAIPTTSVSVAYRNGDGVITTATVNAIRGAGDITFANFNIDHIAFVYADYDDIGKLSFVGGYGVTIDETTGVLSWFGEPLSGKKITIEDKGIIAVNLDLLATHKYQQDDGKWSFGGISECVTTDTIYCYVSIELPASSYDDMRRAIGLGVAGTRGAAIPEELTWSTFIDAFRFVGNKRLIISDSGAISFGDYNTYAWPTKQITPSAKYGFKRGVAGMSARLNNVTFADNECIDSHIKGTINTYNATVADEEDIAEIPFSGTQLSSTYARLDDIVIDDGEYESRVDKPTIVWRGYYSSDGGQVYRAYQPVVTASAINIATLNNASVERTYVTVKTSLSYYEYNAITEGTVLIVDGVRYVWFDSQWSKGTATFTLQSCQ